MSSIAPPRAPSHEAPFARHVLQRTIVLPAERVLFLPVPKSGCTSMLWLLSTVAGIAPEVFARSAGAEASSALTVHDMSLWPDANRVASYDGEERERILTEDGWLRFALVREPAARLWSGWQSKLLLREPRFADAFGGEPWFPRVPSEPEQLVEDFRAFVAALSDGHGEDVHWSVQRGLIRQLPLNHVGRVERLPDTLALLRDHVPAAKWPAQRRRANESPLPMAPHAYDAAAAAVLEARFAADLEEYGYAGAPEAADDGDVEAWEDLAEGMLPALRATIDDRARLAQLHDVAARRRQRVQSAEERLERLSARRVGTSRSAAITNLERETEFNVRWAWADGALTPGFTAVLRVKDESRCLPFVLPRLLRAVEHVVLVDNGSTDGTADVARALAAEQGASGRLDVLEYPFAIARCGAEHLATPATSVHSLVHFYNWSFSHVRTTHALKWDGDMVLSDAGVAALRDLAWQLEAAGDVVVKVPRYPLYLADDRRGYVDVALRNCEPWGWPNGAGHKFVKAMDWELPLWGPDVRTLTLPDFACVELKHLDADEFAHWSHTDFDASARTRRKRREWQVFRALAAGAKAPDGVVSVFSEGGGEHVVDAVRERWLPRMACEGTVAALAA